MTINTLKHFDHKQNMSDHEVHKITWCELTCVKDFQIVQFIIVFVLVQGGNCTYLLQLNDIEQSSKSSLGSKCKLFQNPLYGR